MGSTESKNDKNNKSEKIGDDIVKGLSLGNALQARYTVIPKKGLSQETVGGIWDTKLLGRNRKSIIRFDRGNKTGQPHINIDPKGHPSAKNPHIPVPEGVVQGARILNNTLKYVGPILTVAAVAVDAYLLGKSIKDDVEIQKNADDMLKEIDEILAALYEEREKLRNPNGEYPAESLKEVNELIKHYEKLRKEIRLAKEDKVPCKSIKTGSSIAGGWLAGAGGAYAGGLAGAEAGFLIGTLFGPAGIAVGSFVGAVVGAIGAGIGCGIGGSMGAEAVADFALEKAHDVKYGNAEKSDGKKSR